MKLQLTLVTLAILYGSVTATPIPVDDAFPSNVSIGLDGTLQHVNACQVLGGQYPCPQSRDVQNEEAFPSIVDTALNAIGQGLSDAFQLIAPGEALNGALQAAGACQVRNGRGFCPGS